MTINLNQLTMNAVQEGLINKDDLLYSLMQVIGPSDLRDIIEANDWNNRLDSELPKYKSKALTVEELDSTIDNPTDDDKDNDKLITMTDKIALDKFIRSTR